MDAYEIGLELAALQGVGAGLALMQAEMAAVDAAVAASFAEVPGLIERLGRAGGETVSPVAGMGRAIWPPVAAAAVLPDVVAEAAGTGGAVAPEAAAAAGPRGEAAVPAGPAIAVAPVRNVEGALSSDVVAPGADVAGRVDGGRATMGEASAGEAGGGRAVAPVLVTAQVAPAAAVNETDDRARGGSPAGIVAGERDVERVVSGQGGQAMSPPGQAVLRSDVLGADVLRAGLGRADGAGVAGGGNGASPIGLMQAEDGRGAWGGASGPALAPRGGAGRAGPAAQDGGRRPGGDRSGSGGDASGGGESGGLFGEPAAAPQPQAQDGGDGGGGTVMLDGRLVGQWLSERMARDAGRPGAGTTFFDPRQAPAWTPSGAL